MTIQVKIITSEKLIYTVSQIRYIYATNKIMKFTKQTMLAQETQVMILYP